MTNFSPLKLKTFTWRVVALQLTLQQNDEQEDCPSNMAHLPHCNHEFWKAVQETEWSVQFYRWTLVETSACDLRGTQDLLMMLHVTEQQPVKKYTKNTGYIDLNLNQSCLNPFDYKPVPCNQLRRDYCWPV